MRRVFIAVKVEPSAPLLSMISTLTQGLDKESVKWTNPDNVHITLAFLGNTEETVIRNVIRMLKGKCEGFGKFELVLNGAGVFKNLSDPRILWTGIKLSEKLLQLNEIIINGLREINVNIEGRPFNPHLTLGRIKHISDNGNLISLIERYQNTDIQVVPVDEVILYESILLQTGPVYKPVYRVEI